MRRIYGLLAFLLLIGFMSSNCSKPDVWEMNRWYVQKGRYKDDEIRAFSVWCKVLEEEKIQKICDYYFDKFAEDDRYLQIDFYDNRSFTPDYSKGIKFTEQQGQHIMAKFFYNPYRETKRLEMLK